MSTYTLTINNAEQERRFFELMAERLPDVVVHKHGGQPRLESSRMPETIEAYTAEINRALLEEEAGSYEDYHVFSQRLDAELEAKYGK